VDQFEHENQLFRNFYLRRAVFADFLQMNQFDSSRKFFLFFGEENTLINVALFDQLSKQLYAAILRRKQVCNIERTLLFGEKVLQRESQRGGIPCIYRIYTVSEGNLKKADCLEYR